jgi:hypothetical protein
MNDFIDKLHSYDLYTLQSRIYNKLLLFAHDTKSNKKSSSSIFVSRITFDLKKLLIRIE